MRPVAVFIAGALGWVLGGSALAQPAAIVPAPGAGADNKPVTMDFPADGVDVRVLADVVSRRLKIPIIYDDTIVGKKVIVRVPVDVPESALLGILESALRVKQLALIDGDQPGWKQIVPATNMAAIARPDPEKAGGAATPVVEVIALKHADPARVTETVRTLLTPQAGAINAVSGQRAVIVSDYAPVVRRVGQVIKTLDEGSPVEVKFIPIKNAEPQQVATTVGQILASRDGAPAAGGGGAGGVTITPDERTGQVIVIAPRERMADVGELIAGVDKPIDLDTKVYRLKTIGPDRIDRLVKSLIGAAAAKRLYQSSVDKETQSLVVSATPDVHKRIDALVKELDAPVAEGQSPVRFYKLKNTKAADVLATIAGLMGEGANVNRPTGTNGETDYGRSLLAPPGAPGDNRIPAAGMGASGMRDAVIAPGSALAPGSVARRPGAEDLGPMSDLGTRRGGGMAGTRRRGDAGDEGMEDDAGDGAAKNATVTADVNSNSIIVIAPPAVQETYANLIAKLDVRRPQVQIECTIVTLDTTDNFSFGVDVAKAGGWDNNSVISFGSFGIASVNPTTGRLTPVAAQGGTFALLSPGIADVVIRALASNTKARLVSAPQLLVNDNGKGKLQSVAQEPFAEILDTNTTQSRTGLGGLAQAGTTISVEPHISEDDYMQLAYSIELSSFTGTSRQGLPPPSQKNSVDSSVTIPDGHTIVVGGLKVKNFRSGKDTIPFLDLIPFGDWLIGSRSSNAQELTLFVFIRPVILRDDKFEDLKYLSERATKEVGIPGHYPSSKPIPIR